MHGSQQGLLFLGQLSKQPRPYPAADLGAIKVNPDQTSNAAPKTNSDVERDEAGRLPCPKVDACRAMPITDNQLSDLIQPAGLWQAARRQQFFSPISMLKPTSTET